ncbi:M20/M25/M40 family metallo-hydrolase [Olivibacter sp. CPCC 100613]|uniref:M20/M25/M40 family metallo-hydrolase n=1 Tax=Olivibacter sp. CPCC 100613 TaxID=3079931 RepID=UPI002FF7F6C9
METEKLYEDSLALLKSLISTPSPSGEEKDSAKLIRSFLVARDINVYSVGNNIWAYNRAFNSKKATVLLNSHHDTVLPNGGYRRDPYHPALEEGKLYGLGSNDAGGCLVSLIAAFLHFDSRPELPFNLCLALTAEEENSGQNGIKLVLSHLHSIDMAIVGEPTNMQMAIAEKGNMVITCRAQGRAGHAARTEGDNAISKALRDIQWIEQYRFTKESDLLGPVKMSATQIKGGLQPNIIPDECIFTVDVRLTEAYSADEVLETMKANMSAELRVATSIMNPSRISIEHPIVKAGLALGMKTFASPTCSDQGWLDIPSIKIGPGDSVRSHMADEYIYLREIDEGIKGYIALLDTMTSMLINATSVQDVK